MNGQAAGRDGRIFLTAGVLALALTLSAAVPAADWTAVWKTWAALPWGGPLWWLLRAALALAGGIF